LISSQDIPAGPVASGRGVTVALDVIVDEELKQKESLGIWSTESESSKDMGLEVQDRSKSNFAEK